MCQSDQGMKKWEKEKGNLKAGSKCCKGKKLVIKVSDQKSLIIPFG